ncbi:hypothetical protein B9Q10_01350 [Candidatus Marsarchaeota G2 archaeon ECH_B_SAG-E12]|uniref:P-type ATPase A domain-containing protein n=1 Tax=Candidatus Marsarchaeota G2 archaeon ECH_B_SAG-E12 TaxID=1978164 RepID=A0A2R6BUZ5_9ARCH|nr:MAG: hypothetical protein B9Q10_01350 [Candidatus Marsarchaeota G2 archaeon ECH_B_SAG-E12]
MYSFLQYGISQFIDVAALLIPFILVGRTLELSLKTKMVESVSSIAQKSVSVIRDGKAVTVDQASVKVGDLVLVKPGESIPVDGVVEEGKAEVNEIFRIAKSCTKRMRTPRPKTKKRACPCLTFCF